jgi:hypothetical protein
VEAVVVGSRVVAGRSLRMNTELAPTTIPPGVHSLPPDFDFDVIIATPTTGYVHVQCMAGVLDCAAQFGDSISFAAHGGFLPMTRDLMLAAFLKTHATHMLTVDSDIGFCAAHLAKLLDARQELVSGVAAKKQFDNPKLASGGPTGLRGGRDNELVEMTHVGAGFCLIARSCAERMVREYPNLSYGEGTALYLPRLTPDGFYESEDVAFCSRWRAIGGAVWLHTRCVVDHYGEFRYNPKSVERLLAEQKREGP